MFIFIVSSNPSVQTEPRTKSLLQLSSSAHRPPLLSSFHLLLNSAILWSLTEILPFSPDTRAATAAVVSQPKTVSHTHTHTQKAAFPSFGFPSAEGFICSVYLYKIKFVFIVVALKTLNMFLKKSLEKLWIHANTRKSWLTILELLLLTTTLQRNRVCPSSGTFFFLRGGWRQCRGASRPSLKQRIYRAVFNFHTLKSPVLLTNSVPLHYFTAITSCHTKHTKLSLKIKRVEDNPF